MATTVGSTGSNPFSVSGLASGIDTASIINALVQVDSQPVKLVQSQQAQIKAHLAAIQQMNTNLLAVRSSIDPLLQSTTFAAKAATSSNTALAVSADASANLGTYNLNVKRLATASQFTTTTVQPSATQSLGSSGLITLLTQSGSAVAVQPTDFSLNGIAQAINGANAGINAAVVNDGTGYRLLLTSTQSGAANAILQASGSGDLAAVLGSDGVLGLTEVTHAQDAQVRIGDPATGLLITSPSNVISSAIPGLTLTATAQADNITVSVGSDGGSATTAINGFVSAYNTAQSYFSQNSTYDTTTKAAGQLFSDSILRNQLAALRSAASASVGTQPSGFRSLADLGVTFDDTGAMSVNSATLQSKLAQNPTAVSNLFKAVGASVNSQLDRLTQATNGSLTIEQTQLTAQVTDMDTRIAQMNKQITARQTYYQTQFANMEKMISQLNSQSQALSGLINLSSSSSTKK